MEEAFMVVEETIDLLILEKVIPRLGQFLQLNSLEILTGLQVIQK
jgi:hypothetical protein